MSENANHVVANCHSAKNNKKLFPQKLWDLINDERYNYCLRWSDDGQLVYLNRDEFENSYLKTSENQFHTQKAISFVRQMNMYGFRKVDDCYYENDNFKRGCEHLLKNMIRKHPNKALGSGGVGSSAPEHHSHNHQHHHHHHSFGSGSPTLVHQHQQLGHHLTHSGTNFASRHSPPTVVQRSNGGGQQFRLQPGTLLQRHQRHNQQQFQQQPNSTTTSSGSSSVSTSSDSAAAAAAAAAVVASALAQQQQQQHNHHHHQSQMQHQQQQRNCGSTASSASSAAGANTSSLACRQRLAAAAAAAAFGSAVAQDKANTTNTITTSTSATTTSSTDTYVSQVQESLLLAAQMRAQQQQQHAFVTDDDDVVNINNGGDDSLSSFNDFCCVANGGGQPTSSVPSLGGSVSSVLEQMRPTRSTGSIGGSSSSAGAILAAEQQLCNGTSNDLLQQFAAAGDLKFNTQQAQRQAQLQQVAAQCANLYPEGLDPVLLNQVRALQAAGQLASVTSAVAANSNGLSSQSSTPTNSMEGIQFDTGAIQRALLGTAAGVGASNAAAAANGPSSAAVAAATALAAQQLQPGNLQNNLILNTLIALGILSITSLTQRS